MSEHRPLRFFPLGLALSLLAALPCASAQTAINETRTLSADARVSVSNVKGSIRVVGGEGSTLRLRGQLGEDAELKLSADDPESVSIEIEYPNSSGWGWGGGAGGDTDLQIELPRDARLEVEAVSATVDVRGMNGRSLKISAVSGEVDLRDSAPQQLELETVSGGQRIQTGASELDLESVSGSIEVEASAARRLRAEAVSGDVDVRLQQRIEELRIETVSGAVRASAGPSAGGLLRIETLSGALRLELPADTSARIEAESFSGRIRSPVGEVEREDYGPGSSLDATLGGGESRIRLETFSGAIDLSLQGR
ncbi:DUF4097 family beta strand repeat-containing protein [Aquimonas voraii]|uniref:DUF4097 and DUF4098 domain-containing protein YvlB n=1 Tax=Aquimonas voraii TaxID=265719 RepID=A0A1G6WBV5_9GAMM|nr:DUF4097 family beta strand repeat-containing protein [Aquimonas voraii]SDD62717.1 DUF4097 and DUF4098 domain-containing protein YvlB [Aquimonas voraii]